MTCTVYRFYIEILDASSEIYMKYLLKLLPMLVKLSSISFCIILDQKFGIGTQNLHVNPAINKNQSSIIFPAKSIRQTLLEAY